MIDALIDEVSVSLRSIMTAETLQPTFPLCSKRPGTNPVPDPFSFPGRQCPIVFNSHPPNHSVSLNALWNLVVMLVVTVMGELRVRM